MYLSVHELVLSLRFIIGKEAEMRSGSANCLGIPNLPTMQSRLDCNL
jgi:hypothetical protein